MSHKLRYNRGLDKHYKMSHKLRYNRGLDKHQ